MRMGVSHATEGNYGQGQPGRIQPPPHLHCSPGPGLRSQSLAAAHCRPSGVSPRAGGERKGHSGQWCVERQWAAEWVSPPLQGRVVVPKAPLLGRLRDWLPPRGSHSASGSTAGYLGDFIGPLGSLCNPGPVPTVCPPPLPAHPRVPDLPGWSKLYCPFKALAFCSAVSTL